MNRILVLAALETLASLPEGRVVLAPTEPPAPRLEPPVIEPEPVYRKPRWNESTHPADVAYRRRKFRS